MLLVWALDRLARGGTLDMLQIIHRLGERGVRVISYQGPWTEAGGDLLDLLLAIVGWVARMESNRRSERTKAGLERAVSQGKRLGRPPGSKDRKKRSRRGLAPSKDRPMGGAFKTRSTISPISFISSIK